MSYQVLARKWRPNRFAELVGQEHVVTAISNALDNNRLHHAYLFTGTRGVGKTTIARIFSKSLNCEQGLGANPCGQCSTCQEIEQGNFIDLLEIDAASRTKVEDTRELLDNVQYKPSRGRYKVYLIDEVHMLSKHSFNALLKTLEEPPPHVKFLLATTDPQKLPVTILSRCLQFNLKALSRAQISKQLEFVLAQESLPFEKEGVAQLARAAQGSMRDALSLTDQAIAQGNGQVSLQIVTDMLGLMDKNQVIKVVHAVVQKDNASVMQQVEAMAEQAPDYAAVLAEMMSLLHQIALTQFVPDACKLETISARAIYQLAKSTPAEQIQLLYQIALSGKKDLPYAADPRTGFEMTLLRMLAFCPGNLDLDAVEIAQQTPVLAQPNEQMDPQISPVVDSVKSLAEAVNPQTETEKKTEPEALNEPQLNAPQDEQSIAAVQPTDTSEPEVLDNAQGLFVEQQDIISQAEEQGFQGIDYDKMVPVGLDESVSEPGPAPDTPHSIESPQPKATTTADLIALRNKLKANQEQEEGDAEQVKKSENLPLPDLASIRKQNLNTAVDEPVAAEPVKSEPALAESVTTEHVTVEFEQNKPEVPETPEIDLLDDQPYSQEDTPPWATEESELSPVAPSADPQLQSEPEVFDPNAHLDEENIGEVTVSISAFLPDNQKVIHSQQVDDWSKLINDMQVTALTKQLALHSAFSKNENVVRLTLLENKAHLDSPSARQQLTDAISGALNTNIQLEIELGQPINTPYALQMEINKVRKTYAREVIQNDTGVKLLQEQFSAKVDGQSIQAR